MSHNWPVYNGIRLLSDHIPLISLINTQILCRKSLSFERLLMRLGIYNCEGKRVPGEQLTVPDTLLRLPVQVNYSTKETGGKPYKDFILEIEIGADNRSEQKKTGKGIV